MKKKLLSIVMSMFLILSGICFAACGDTYKDMRFKVSYAFSLEDPNWIVVDSEDGIQVNYDTEQGAQGLVMNQDGEATIFVKVEVEGVDPKHTDDIIVSTVTPNNNLDFVSSTIKHGEIIELTISGNVTTSLNIVETNSNKSSRLNFSAHRKLTAIEVKNDIVPAIVVGGQLDLTALNNLKFLPEGENETNQTGVIYKFATSARQGVTLDSGILSINESQFINLSKNNNEIIIDAISTADETIKATFKVFIVEKASLNSVMDFRYANYVNDPNNYDEDKDILGEIELGDGKSISALDLYFGGLVGGDNYATTTIKVDFAKLAEESIYAEQISTVDDKFAEYKVSVWLKNANTGRYELYDLTSPDKFSELSDKYGIVIEEAGGVQGEYHNFDIILTQDTPSVNIIKFVMSINGLDFVGEGPKYEKELLVTKKILPTGITINAQEIVSNTASGTIYTNSTADSLKLTLGATPIDVSGLSNHKIYLNALENVNITYLSKTTGQEMPLQEYVAGQYVLNAGDTIIVRFSNGNIESGSFNIFTPITPETFDGMKIATQFKTVSYFVEKKTTADDFELFATSDAGAKPVAEGGNIKISKTNDTNFYLKVYHTGTLDEETITLSSANENIKFGNGKAEAKLNDGGVYTNTQKGLGYTIYTIKLIAPKNDSNSLITIIAGDENTDVDTNFNAQAVETIAGLASEFSIKPSRNTRNNVIDCGNGRYVLLINQHVDFEVKYNNSINAIENVKLLPIIPEGVADASKFSLNILSLEEKITEFGATSVYAGQTEVVKVSTHYYKFDNGEVKIGVDEKYVEIAVYDPIYDIDFELEKNELVYVNEKYLDAKTTTIDIDVFNKNQTTLANTVTFTTGNKIGACSIKISYNVQQYANGKFKLTINNKNVLNGSILSINEAGYVCLDGEQTTFTSLSDVKFELTLTDDAGENDFVLRLEPLTFGQAMNYDFPTTVKFLSHQDIYKVSSIQISGEELVVDEFGSSAEVQMSFIDVENGGSDVASINVEAYYETANVPDNQRFDDIGFYIYKVNVDDDGHTLLKDGKVDKELIENKEEITIEIIDNIATITAFKAVGGGRYIIEFYALDSYDGAEYKVTRSINLYIADGSVKFKYLLKTEQDLLDIENDLTANYVLANNIVIKNSFKPIGKNGKFTGVLTGGYETIRNDILIKNVYGIAYTVAQTTTVETTDEVFVLAGLFARLGDKAKIENLNINVDFNTRDFKQTDTKGNLYIGAIAGINDGGKVENVFVTISNNVNFKFRAKNDSNADLITNGNVYFGGYFGANKGNINLTTSSINCEEKVTIDSNAFVPHYIALVAGINSGNITGVYQDKESLKYTLSHEIVANLAVITENTNDNYVAGVAGVNKGAIKNLMIGGEISYTNNDRTTITNDFLAGITAKNERNINTCAVYPLNLNASGYNPVDVAGIAGLNSGNIKNIRVMTSVMDFDQAELSGVTGKMTGNNIVAGAVAKSTSTSHISYISVENFISKVVDADKNVYNFYTLNSINNKIAGLVYENNGEVNNSFVNVNLYYNTNVENTVYLTSNGVENNTYFIGKLSVDYSQYKDQIDANSTYALVYNTTDIYNAKTKTALDLTTYNCETGLNVEITNPLSNWALHNERNFIKIGDVNYYFPYLLKENGSLVTDTLMIDRPTGLNVELNKDNFDAIAGLNSIYIESGFDFVANEKHILETLIINFKQTANGIVGNNEYTFVTLGEDDDKIEGLINTIILPINAQAGLRYRILQGSNYAYVIGNTITFKAVSGNNPIVIECYSTFNDELVCYVVFYSQYGLTDITIDSSAIKHGSSEISTYIGANNISVQIDAQNIYQDVEYKNIFDAVDTSSLVVDAKVYTTFDAENPDQNIDLETLEVVRVNNFNFNVKVNKDVIFGETEEKRELIIVFTLKLDIDKYLDATAEGGINFKELKSKAINVVVHRSATRVEILDSDITAETKSNMSFGASVYSGFVNQADKDNTEYTPIVMATVDDAKDNVIYLQDGNGNFEDNTRDSIILVVEGDETKGSPLNKLMAQAGVNKIVDLFDFEFAYLPIVADGKVAGYTYKVLFNLKDIYNYRYIERDIVLNFIVVAASNDALEDSITVTITPTKLSTARLENYAVKKIEANTNYTSLITTTDTPTSVIMPGGTGGIIAIYMENAYSNIVSAEIVSSALYVNSLSRDVYVDFEQVVYNEATKSFETLIQRNDTATSGHGIKFDRTTNTLVTSKDAQGKFKYSGVIYVHTILEKFVGLEDTIQITLNVVTGSVDNPIENEPYAINLITNYIPGAYLQYTENKIDNVDGYLIQEDTADNYFELKAYGYQFNADPDIEISWAEGYDGNQVASDFVSYYPMNNYDAEIDADGAYVIRYQLIVKKNIPYNFKVSAELRLVDKYGNHLVSDPSSLNFYPTKYLLKSVNVLGAINNGMINIARGDSKTINLNFETQNKDVDYSNEISEMLFTQLSNEELINKFSFAGLDSRFEDPFYTFFRGTTDYIKVELNSDNSITLYGINQIVQSIGFDITYTYKLNETTNKYEVQFDVVGSGSRYLNTTFNINVYFTTTEENAIPITTAEEFTTYVKQEDVDLILMEDIVLDAWNPIDTKIASLDGNNKIITIKSFARNSDVSNYGLFSSIGKFNNQFGDPVQTILKNVIVDYSQFTDGVQDSTNPTLNLKDLELVNIKFGGLVAINDGGLIYNCDVINNSESNKEFNIIVDDNKGVTVVFGGLVAENEGIITNSRVGRASYDKVSSNGTKEIINTKPITFNIGGTSSVNFIGITGGFVGKNNGMISSSYVANTGVVSYANDAINSKLAGFVAENTTKGMISYSYVTALESTLTDSSAFANGNEIAVVKSKTSASVAGFVYSNSGKINNAYSNVDLKSESNYMSGFVYENSGTISESYAAATFNGIAGGNNVAHRPFTGVKSDSDGELLNTGTLKNVYYLETDVNLHTIIDEIAVALTRENFGDSQNLNGFVFILSNSSTEREQGVWSYIDGRILPELISVNKVSHSMRSLTGTEVDKDSNQLIYNYTDAKNYEKGSKNNPYIIRNVAEYNDMFTGGLVGTTTKPVRQTGYFRFINNIDFEQDRKAVKTRSYYTLGSKDRAITSVDGNGMTISGIYLDTTDGNEQSIGLFASIENAYIKNLNLEFVSATGDVASDQYSTLAVQASGGLAGTISNSIIINIDLNGQSTTIAGKNYVGGLAGVITGKSLIYGISSNLNVKVSTINQKHMYNGTLSNSDSYAGGLAGVIDLVSRGREEFNLSFIDINGYEMGTRAEANIQADFAGGVAGYVNETVNSLRVNFYTGVGNKIAGNYVAGGLYAIALGDITASQVTADYDTQYKIDTEIGKYIVAQDKGEDVTLDMANSEKYGNTSLINSSNGIAGGLVGIGIGSTLNSTLSKASFGKAEIVGGSIGYAVSTKVSYSYALPVISEVKADEKIGGLFGVVDHKSQLNTICDALFEGAFANDFINELDDTADVQFTMSTVILNTDKLTNVEVDYICADCEYGSEQFLTCNSDKKLTLSYIGIVNNYIPGGDVSKYSAKTVDLNELYDATDNDHVTAFNTVFASWAQIPYWSLDSDKYFPLLSIENAHNFIIIRNQNDLSLIQNNPKGNFMIVEDIQMLGMTSNWVIPGTFQGVIVGRRESDNGIPVISGVSLNTNEDDTSGFFKETQGATISNLVIEYLDEGNGAIKVNNKVPTIAGLSCKDNGSQITNVEVRVKGKLTNKNYLVNNSGLTQTTKVAGLIGEAVNTELVTCKYSGSINAKLNKDTGEFKDVYFGGLIADSKKQSLEGASAEDEKYLNNAIQGCNVGINKMQEGEGSLVTGSYSKTVFKITLGNNSIAYIGGAIGSTAESSVAGVKVGGVGYDSEYQSINISIDIKNTIAESTLNVGGLIASNNHTNINSCDALTNITVKSSYTAKDSYIGGLVGCNNGKSFTSPNEIEFTNVKSTINLNGFIASVLHTGMVSARAENTIISSVLATGEISNDNSSQIKYIYAGGLVGMAEKYIGIDTTMSDVDLELGTSTTEKIYAGGFIGHIEGVQDYEHTVNDVKTLENSGIEDAITSGKIYIRATGKTDPGKTNTGLTDTVFYIGGVIGYIDDTSENNCIELYKVISTTSIIASGVQAGELPGLHTGAVLGGQNKDEEITLNTENVYYSTDIALATEETKIGYNLGANILTKTKVWHTKFNGDVWRATDDGMLYLNTLASSVDTNNTISRLSAYGIIDGNNYILGSSLNPITINSTKVFAEDDDYAHYILTADVFVSGTLNGVLIGHDFGANNYTQALGLSIINANSAVSNYHANIGGEKTTLGIVVDVNYGVIFNCSVQGNAIEDKKTYSDTSGNGLIAGNNFGLVSHSFSTAEVLSTGGLGGIVGNNGATGKISTCYFTGYIEQGAGIVMNNAGYAYNCYMAGKVNDFGKNSFVYNVNGDFAGSNNYVDRYANDYVEGNLLGEDNDSIQTVNTASLVLSKMLFGSWYVSAKEDEQSNILIDTEKPTFGFNYCYPIYNFNKLYVTASERTDYEENKDKSYEVRDSYIVPIRNQLYTGTGTKDGAVEFNKNSESFATVINNFDDNDYYNHAFKIPHLGVLSMLQTLKPGDENHYRTYVLIYDIDGEYKTIKEGKEETEFASWNNSIGEPDVSICGFDSNRGNSFSDLFVSNKNFAFNEFESDDTICTIQNLSTKGLFTNINNAYFGYLNFGSMYLNSSDEVAGSLGEVVGNTTGEVVGNTTVNNVGFIENTKIQGGSGKFVGALFGKITQSSVSINKLTAAGITFNGVDNAGVIAGKIDDTAQVVIESANITVVFDNLTIAGAIAATSSGNINANSKSTFAVSFLGGQTDGRLGGLIGEMKDGELKNVDSVSIRTDQSEARVDVVGGIVGELSNGLIQGINVVINEEQTESLVNTLGGFVAVAKNGTIDHCTLKTNNQEIVINKIGTSDGGFIGLIAGKLINNNEALEVKNCKLDIKTLIVKGGGASENTTNGVGALVGYQKGDLNITAIEGSELTITADNIANLGGIAGVYEGGTLEADESLTQYKITLIGCVNVGGLYGYGTFLAEQIDNKPNVAISITNTLEMSGEEADREISYQNIGGIYGRLDSNNSITSSLTNNTPISFVEDTSSTKVVEVENVGGIAGLYDGKSIKGVYNEKPIAYNDASLITKIDKTGYNQYITEANSIMTKNVGGIFGSASIKEGEGSAYISGTNNFAVQGYKNVGGIVGLVEYATVDGTTGECSVVGVYNVGGIVGNANDSAIQGSSKADVYGNQNVGGAVGCITGSESQISCVVTSGQDSTNPEVENEDKRPIVKGLYYRHRKKDLASETDYRVVDFIPTSVGGLVGCINGEINKISDSKVLARVSSTKEGNPDNNSGEGSTQNYPVISTISNNILGSVSSLSGIEENKVKFQDMQTGFGGLVGTVTGKINYFENNQIQDLDINAQLGINVGSIYGYVNNSSETDFGSIVNNVKYLVSEYEDQDSEPHYNNILIDGSYFVGSLFGNIGGSGNSSISNIIDQEIKSVVDNSNVGQFKIQSRLSGMYIGGLIGKAVNSQVDGLKIRSNTQVRIDTSKSYYMGGLVGQWKIENTDGEGIAKFGTETDGVGSQVTTSTISNDLDSAENFGGLLGMIKVAEVNSDGITVKVSGEHKYPFTVNTIENCNYYDGESQFNSNISSEELTLTAQAFYVNLDSFDICATSNDVFYKSGATNPLNSSAKGWAKEYTGFKVIQRCIPAGASGTDEWDSIGVVYDAVHITHVATAGSLGLSGQSYKDERLVDSSVKNDTSTTYKAEDIVYTVYDKGDGLPYLYSRVGIATLATNEQGNLIANTTDLNNYRTYKKDIFDQINADFFENTSAEERQQLTDNIDKFCPYDYTVFANNQLGYFDWNDSNYGTLIDVNYKTNSTDCNYKYKSLKYNYYYKLDNYLGNTSSTYFEFKTIYANASAVNDIGADRVSYTSISVPKSGSVFDVCGFKPAASFDIDTQESVDWFTKQWRTWGKTALTIIVDIVIIVATWGGGSAWVLAKAAAKFAKLAKIINAIKKMKRVMKIIKMLSKAAAIMACINAYMTITDRNSFAENVVSETFFATENQNFGLLGNSSTMEIRYEDGKVVYNASQTFDLEEKAGAYIGDDPSRTDYNMDGVAWGYYYYSRVRPVDYYSEFYISFDMDHTYKMTDYCDDGPVYKNSSCDYTYYSKTVVDGSEVFIPVLQKYIYRNGAYYVSNLAGDISYYRTQLNANSIAGKDPTLMINDNGTYVCGNYSSGVYTFSNDPFGDPNFKNLIEYIGGKYYLNGYEIDAIDSSFTNDNVEFSFRHISMSSLDPETAMLISSLKEGYQKMTGVYYTANGVASESVSKMAKFKAVTYKPTTGTEGVDWISRSVTVVTGTQLQPDGSTIDITHSAPAYFVIEGLSSATEPTENIGGSWKIESNIAIPQGNISIDVELYPSTFIDPYQNNGYSYKENDVYVNTKTIDSTTGVAITLPEGIEIGYCPTYFYFEGGYITDKSLDSSIDKGHYIYEKADLGTDEKDRDKIYIDIYDGDGNLQKISGSSLIPASENEGSNITISNLISNWSSWAREKEGSDYKYFADITSLEEDALYNTYKIYSGNVYIRIKNYVIGNEEEIANTENGYLYRRLVSPIDKASGDNGFANRYLSNNKFGLYTLYKYIDKNSRNIDFSENIEKWLKSSDGENKEYYRIIPVLDTFKTGIPNDGYVTNFTDSVKVSLGCGMELDHLFPNSSSRTTKTVGKITIV